MKRYFLKTNVRSSFWLATGAVIGLIVLLALTVNYARQKAVVRQFGLQQQTIVFEMAKGIEVLISSVRRNMLVISELSPELKNNEMDKCKVIESVYRNLGVNVGIIGLLDKEGFFMCGYPSHGKENFLGTNFGDIELFKKQRATKKPLIEHVYSHLLVGPEDRSGSILISVPEFDASGRFSGIIFACMPLSMIVDQFIKTTIMSPASRYWMANENGNIVASTVTRWEGKSVNSLFYRIEGKKYPGGETPLKAQGYGEYVLKDTNVMSKRDVVAYAPIKIGDRIWTLAIVTPYNIVVSSIRGTFSYIVLGTLSLVILVIVTGMSIASSSAKRLRMEEELKRLKERDIWQRRILSEKRTVEGIIEGSPVPTFVVNKDHKVVFWNRACAELTGFSREEMIGTDRHWRPFYKEKRPVIADIIIDNEPDVLAKYYAAKGIRKSATVKGAYEARDFFKNFAGKDRHLYFLAAPIYDVDGNIIYAIETLMDITREVEMTRNLKENAEVLQNELKENIRLRKEKENLYNYLQTIVESLPDKIFEISPEGIISFVNKETIGKGGTGLRAMKGKHFTEFVAPEHKEFVLKKWEDAKKGIFRPYELQVTARDGTRRDLLITPRPVKGTNRYLLVQRDITELKELESKYCESKHLTALGQLSAGIAHEIRNPLSSIKMSLRILQKRLNPKGNDLKRFEIAQREVEHLERLVNDVLVFAKPSEPKKKPSNITNILEQALSMVEQPLLDKGIEVEKMFDEGTGPVDVDPMMLERAFINIFQNSIDAMDQGGVLTITARRPSDDEASYVVIEVKDNGCGIAESDLQYLFNPFFTRKRYGTGLGLSQVQRIVDQHKGKIEILSEEGKGTRFIVRLPLGNAKGIKATAT